MNSFSDSVADWDFKPRTDGEQNNKQLVTSQPFISNKDAGARWTKELGASPEAKEQEETTSTHMNDRGFKLISGSHGTMCHSTAAVNPKQPVCETGLSYSYSYSSEQLGTKVEMVYNLLSMLGTHDRAEMTSTLLAMSSSPDSCRAMRQSGCLSLLVQLIHSSGESTIVRQRASQALRNMVLCHGDDKRGRREARVLRLLDQLMTYIEGLSEDPESHAEESHPGSTIMALMKLSFDEEHRLAMCHLGGLYVIAKLVQVEASYTLDCCISLKRYAAMALTNLTFGDGNNKALLCSMKPFMVSLVTQLSSSSEDLTQVTASVFRNLSWRADAASRQTLREVGSVPALMKAAMSATRESTLKSVLSALWNLSAHCNVNKIDICGVEGAIQYLVEMLNYQSASKTLLVVENVGGILRNISSHIAVREDYRKILREHNCLAILLKQLTSASLTVVSNACGTLWNLSTRCPNDQRALVALGAVPMLTSLAQSRHRMIAMGASATLKNLLPIRLAQQQHQTPSGGTSLLVRKRRALEAELNTSFPDACPNNLASTPNWETRNDLTPPTQSKDETDDINHSVQQLSIEETSDEPINYSLKFGENETKGVEIEPVNFENDPKTYKGHYSEDIHGSDYAETDLDQLTDYSLRYNEEEHLDPASNTTEELNKCEEEVEKPIPEAVISVEASPTKNDSGKATVLETPLMFSRCSSLGSLSSCEQHDDCQSSVVSEFSRVASGILSPSELPDSPTQTVPPSPRVTVPPPPPVSEGKELRDGESEAGVFEDTVVAFKEESTPAQFSCATSLSDLTFDEDHHDGGERKELELSAVSEEEDEHVLADCINIGMQNNRDRVEASGGSSHSSRMMRVSGIPVKASLRHHVVRQVDENPVQFCTEDTPANLSHATSRSELSNLSDGGSSDHDNILAECIQSGMPQAQGSPSLDKSRSSVQTVIPSVKVAPLKHRPLSIPNSRMKQLVAEDEVSVFATEGSPCNFSVRSSLSDLTVNSRPDRGELETPPPAENPSPLSSLDPADVSIDEREAVTILSGASADDVTLADQEDQVLLMQVISSGMPSGDKMRESCDTWAEDTGNSFPSISLTAPVISSYASDDEKDLTDPDTYTQSRVIQLEKGQVGLISHLEMESSYVPLDQVQPPSNMASIISLTGSTTSFAADRHPDFKFPDDGESSFIDLESVQPPSAFESVLSLSFGSDTEKRKRGMGMGGSLLENVKPPAEMDELLDLDNSIQSVASITSEVAESEEATLEAFTPPSQRKMTPKQRRDFGKISCRYNTYVINKEDKKPLPPLENEPEPLPASPSPEIKEKVREKTTPKQRRQADRDRFRTRTIHDAPTHIDRLSSVDSEEAVQTLSSSSLSEPSDLSEPASESQETPRPIVVKPAEVKTVRGGGGRSSIPVSKSPVKVVTASSSKKKGGGASSSPTPGNLQRQGTFTKEEASSGIPVPVKKPTNSPLKKAPLSSGSKSAPLTSGSGRGRAGSLPNKGTTSGVRASVSNQSLKSACRDENSSTRWHSNSSLNSPQAVKKDSTSKIASLWKKVDENKKKQVPHKDTRVWIPPTDSKPKQVT